MIRIGTMEDIDELEKLYDDLHDYLRSGSNYPGWIKRVYPVKETAETAIADGNRFILKIGNKIAGSIILNHKPEEAYNQANWSIEIDYSEIPCC